MSAVNASTLELQQRRRYAPIALLAGALLIIGIVIQTGGVHSTVNEDTIFLISESKRSARDVITAILTGVSFLALSASLRFLYLATKRRQPAVGAYLQVLVVAAGVISAVIGVVFEIVIAGKASDFVSHGTQTYVEAKALLHGFMFTVLPVVNLAAQAALAICFVLLSLGAMRVGLLTRFMGYLGMIAGAFFILNIGAPVVIVQGFWLIALGVLFAGRWPYGTPPAWESGTAIPWPTSQEMREQRVRAMGDRSGGRAARGGSGGGAAQGGGARGSGQGGAARGDAGGRAAGSASPAASALRNLRRGLGGGTPASPPAPAEPAKPAAPHSSSHKRKRKRRK